MFFARRACRSTPRGAPSSAPGLHRGPGVLHRVEDVEIAGAAAEIGRQRLAQPRLVDIGLALQHAQGQHQESRGAEAALQRVTVDEGPLQRVQLIAVGEPLHRPYLATLRLAREHQAAPHRRAVEQDRAGAAHPVLAAEMGAGQPAILADRVGQRLARLDADGMRLAVDRERDFARRGHRAASASARSTITAAISLR